jgi:hypothetical protein
MGWIEWIAGLLFWLCAYAPLFECNI